jgi:hypothetical protein
MVNPHSLAATLDAFTEATRTGDLLAPRERQAIATWLAGQCQQDGSYEGMPAPTPEDFAGNPRLFTGEPLSGRGGMACKLGNEACRALIELAATSPAVQTALRRAEEQMRARLEPATAERAGFYCCGSCSVAVWRHLRAGGLDRQEERLARGMKLLHRARLDNGSWRFYPSWYTVWALLEIDDPAARIELEYAAPRLERYLKRPPRLAAPYAARRAEIARQVLARV